MGHEKQTAINLVFLLAGVFIVSIIAILILHERHKIFENGGKK